MSSDICVFNQPKFTMIGADKITSPIQADLLVNNTIDAVFNGKFIILYFTDNLDGFTGM
jgi:hypothetical protein